uniref:Uncharacterized protein n=1 Tax=Trypanosoma congolense (strain IL3000) TaxID=1068625 RepID=G0UL37_TRYCI|nr:hypothetical protein, unlikely [Trypanosoma congolense IL3000]
MKLRVAEPEKVPKQKSPSQVRTPAHRIPKPIVLNTLPRYKYSQLLSYPLIPFPRSTILCFTLYTPFCHFQSTTTLSLFFCLPISTRRKPNKSDGGQQHRTFS